MYIGGRGGGLTQVSHVVVQRPSYWAITPYVCKCVDLEVKGALRGTKLLLLFNVQRLKIASVALDGQITGNHEV